MTLYGKARWDAIKEELVDTEDKNKIEAPTKSTNQLWLTFKEATTYTMQRHIPTKTCNPKDNLHYIISKIKKLIRQKAESYETVVKSGI